MNFPSLNAALVPSRGRFSKLTPSRRSVQARVRPLDKSDHKIVIIESRSLLQGCLGQLIGQGLGQPVEAFGSSDEFLATQSLEGVSLLVYCTNEEFSSVSGSSKLNHIIKFAGDIPVVVSSDVEDVEAIVGTLKLGARGYIPMSLKLEIWIEALRLVKAGGIFAPAGALLKMSASVMIDGQGKGTASEFALTRRQMAVVHGLSQGKANKIIAFELNMCESTVKVHVRNIMKKLRAKNRTEVALMASEILKYQNSSL